MLRRRLVFFAALVALFAGSIVAWTQDSGFQIININPFTGEGGEPVGYVESITSIGGTFSVYQGATLKTHGIELYEIILGDKALCPKVRINLALQNAYDMGQVLNNPTARIDVGIWYPVDYGSTEYPDPVFLDRISQNVWRDDGPDASKKMSREMGAVTLKPSKEVTSTLYILGSIVVGKAQKGYPPAQQKQLLKFWCEVRM